MGYLARARGRSLVYVILIFYMGYITFSIAATEYSENGLSLLLFLFIVSYLVLLTCVFLSTKYAWKKVN